jgi:hypothetical protein
LRAKYDRASGTPMERWWAKVRKDPDGHWYWIGSLDRYGYGQFDVIDENGHKNHRAHRWGYQQLVRVLDADEVLDHLCRIHDCVNPDCLEPVTNAENLSRQVPHNSAKTHCKRGHEFTPENTAYYGPTGDWRRCRECMRIRTREFARRRGVPA